MLDWHFAVWQPAFAEEKETDMLLHEYQVVDGSENVDELCRFVPCVWRANYGVQEEMQGKASWLIKLAEGDVARGACAIDELALPTLSVSWPTFL